MSFKNLGLQLKIRGTNLHTNNPLRDPKISLFSYITAEFDHDFTHSSLLLYQCQCMTMSDIQQRFLSNTNYYQGNYNDYDSGYDYGGRDYNTQGHGSGYGGQGHHAGYRGHGRPIVIIQPPSQPQADPILEGLTSLIPLAYLLPLALLATAAAPTTTVVGNGRRKRQVHGNELFFLKQR